MVHLVAKTAVPYLALAACAALVFLAVSAPVGAHVGQASTRVPAAQQFGHVRGTPPSDPLSAFTFITPSFLPDGSPNPNVGKPCEPADQMTGVDPTNPGNSGPPLFGSEPLIATHIGHVDAMISINQAVGGSGSDGYPEFNSVDFFHLSHLYGEPGFLEGGYDGAFSMMGWDGFYRMRMSQLVRDIPDMMDLQLVDLHPFSSYCVYGSTSPDGPYLFIGSAFKKDYSTTELDFKYYYTPLWKQQGYAGNPVAEYFMLVGSLDKWPALYVDYSSTPLPPYMPGTLVNFQDESTIYGWKKRDIAGSGFQTNDQVHNFSPDCLFQMDWWIDSDRTLASDVDMTTAPFYTASGNWGNSVCGSPPPGPGVIFAQTGDFEVCEKVTSKEGLSGVKCKRHEARDMPPIASFSVRSDGCFFPFAEFEDTSEVLGDDVIMKIFWDLGDDTTATGSKVTHTYVETGTYNVTLTVTDEDDQSSSTYRYVFAVGSKECGVPPGTSKDESTSGSVPKDGVSESNAAADTDDDTIPDRVDSCPGFPNKAENFARADLDEDGIGDSCDDDKDGDGALNDADLCPEVPEEYATDVDADKVGDSCDADADGDGIENDGNPRDICPLFVDPLQADMDQDGIGDLCDADLDGDRYANALDAFPYDPNEWEDKNGNGIGDHLDFIEAEAAELKGRTQASVEVDGRKAPGLAPLLLLALVAGLVVLVRRK